MNFVRRYFISCASAEFRSYRDALRQHLTTGTADTKVQEDFTNGPRTLLEKLDDYIGKATAVLHLVGKWAGSVAKPAEVRAILARYPDFPSVVPELADCLDPDSCPLTYTQWEAFLAIYHRIPCFIYIADDTSQRETGWTEDAQQTALQQQHMERLRKMAKDRETLPFQDAKDVAISFYRSLDAELTGAAFAQANSIGAAITWPAVTTPSAYGLADREPEVELFVKLISGQTAQRILLLHGPSDRGKSSLLTEFENLSLSNHGLGCARAEFKNGPSLREVLFSLSQDLPGVRFARFHRDLERNAVEPLRTAFLQDISESLQPVVLLLDTYEDATDEARQWVEQHLFNLARRFDGLRIVVAGQQVPQVQGTRWESLAIRRELPPITDAAHWCRYARDVLNVPVTEAPDEHITTMVKAAQGSPRPLGTLLSNLREGAC
jgi:hypothetical protein